MKTIIVPTARLLAGGSVICHYGTTSVGVVMTTKRSIVAGRVVSTVPSYPSMGGLIDMKPSVPRNFRSFRGNVRGTTPFIGPRRPGAGRSASLVCFASNAANRPGVITRSFACPLKRVMATDF